MNSQLQIKFLRKHGIIAGIIGLGMFAVFLQMWHRSLSVNPDHARSAASALLLSTLVAVAFGLGYWMLARLAARNLDNLVISKPYEPLNDAQRASISQIKWHVHLMTFGGLMLFFALLGIASFFEPVPEQVLVIVAYAVGIPALISFAYRQGLHDAQKSQPDSPAQDEKR